MYRKIWAIIAVLLCLASVSTAQDIKGFWAGAFDADEVFMAMRINFDESKIIMSFAGSERAGAIKNLQTIGDEISFTAEMQPQARFKGKIKNEKIEGTFDLFRSNGTKSGSGVWNARKIDSFDFNEDSKSVSTDEKIELPKPSGAFSIGRKFFYWTDESRPETITDDPNDKRKLFVQLWYPAKSSNKKQAAAEYYPNLEELRGKDENIAVLRAVNIHANTNAQIAVAKTNFPVIIFSPGLGMSPFSYTGIIENLVSRGYVVAAINHAYDTGDFKFSDGQTIRYAAEKWDREAPKDWTADERKQFFDQRRISWAQDVSFVVNQLEKLEKPFKSALDLQNLGMLGHSFGGQAATIACASDARFKACANLDGLAQGNAFLPDASGKILKQPFIFFNKSAEVTDYELKIMNLTRSEYRARERKRLLERWKPSFKTRLAELESGAYFALYPGIKHLSFSDVPLLETNAKNAPFAERLLAAQIINEYISAFFDKYLMKKDSLLLDTRNQTRPQVILEFLKQDKSVLK